MVHLRPIILALLLAVAGPAAAIPSSAPTAQSSATATADAQVYAPANTSSLLTLGEDAEETRAFARQSLDVGTSLAIEKDSMDRQFDRDIFIEQFSRIEAEEKKRDLIFKYATRIQSVAESLEARESNARQNFQSGALSAGEYVRTLSRINEEAERLQEEVNLIAGYTDQVQFPLNDYLGSLEKRIQSLRGPIRSESVGSLNGNAPSVSVYVAAAESGVVLSKIEDGTYTREIYRSDLRDINNDGYLSDSGAEAVINNTYPWAFDNKNSDNWNSRGNIKGYHTYGLGYSHGEVFAYIDTTNAVVFKDYQRKYLNPTAASRNDLESTMPKGPGVTANESDLLLTVNRSYAGGPMYVALRDNETGEFVEGTVAIDGEAVGETTIDGGLWTISPAGSFNVSASSNFDVVTVETRATRPIRNRNATQS